MCLECFAAGQTGDTCGACGAAKAKANQDVWGFDDPSPAGSPRAAPPAPAPEGDGAAARMERFLEANGEAPPAPPTLAWDWTQESHGDAPPAPPVVAPPQPRGPPVPAGGAPPAGTGGPRGCGGATTGGAGGASPCDSCVQSQASVGGAGGASPFASRNRSMRAAAPSPSGAGAGGAARGDPAGDGSSKPQTSWFALAFAAPHAPQVSPVWPAAKHSRHIQGTSFFPWEAASRPVWKSKFYGCSC